MMFEPGKHINTLKLVLCAVLISSLLVSCSVTRSIPPGDALYTGAKLHTDNSQDLTPIVISKMNAAITPAPNKKFLGLRWKLWFYNITTEPEKKKGWRYFWKYKVGEAPVLLSSADPERTVRLLENRMHTSGYFRSDATFKVSTDKKKAFIDYYAHPAPPYFIKEVMLPLVTTRLERKIHEASLSTLIKPGDQYSLDVIKLERERIDAYLKHEGYYFFGPDFLLFQVDSTVGNHQCNLRLRIKPDVPPEALIYYRINNIYLFPEYTTEEKSISQKYDTLQIDSIYFITADHIYREKIILNTVYFKQNEIYNSTNYDLTLKRSMGLGAFKYGTIKLTAVPGKTDDVAGMLDVNINLTPFRRYSLRSELELVTKSNQFTGPGASIALQNRNTFRGAETFSLTFNGNYEQQFFTPPPHLTALAFGIQPELYFPRIIPLHQKRTNSVFTPKTKLGFGYNINVREEYYTLNSFNINLGWIWKETITKQHEWNPFAISYVLTTNTTEKYDSILNLYPSMRESFEKQFILGNTYTYTFTDQVLPQKRNPVFFRGRVDIAGNVLFGLQTLFNINNPGVGDTFTVLGQNYAVYSLGETDFRYYYKTGKQSKLIGRLDVGVGVPYGNSTVLPYAKRFYSGGVNSLRGFRYKSIGPGSYYDSTLINSNYYDQTGSMKLEANLEWRFPIFGYLKGAMFLDAGNIWEIIAKSSPPEALFKLNRFYKEIAVSAGMGLRLDIEYFVVRTDFAVPVRKYLPEKGAFGFNTYDFGYGSWRKDNIIFNLAIGYPF